MIRYGARLIAEQDSTESATQCTRYAGIQRERGRAMGCEKCEYCGQQACSPCGCLTKGCAGNKSEPVCECGSMDRHVERWADECFDVCSDCGRLITQCT